VAGATVEVLHELAAGLAGAQGTGSQRALRAVPAPVVVAGGAPAAHRPPGRSPTVRAAPRRPGRGSLQVRRALDAVRTPVYGAPRTPPASRVPRRAGAPTNA